MTLGGVDKSHFRRSSLIGRATDPSRTVHFSVSDRILTPLGLVPLVGLICTDLLLKPPLDIASQQVRSQQTNQSQCLTLSSLRPTRR